MEAEELGVRTPDNEWKKEYETEYRRVFGKEIKLVGGRTGVFKIKSVGGAASRAGYRRSDIARMLEDLKSRPAHTDDS